MNEPGKDLTEVDDQTIRSLAMMVDEVARVIIEPATNATIPKIRTFLKSTGIDVTEIEIEIVRFELINLIYWAGSFYKSMLSFDGIIENSSENFSRNFYDYTESLGLEHAHITTN